MKTKYILIIAWMALMSYMNEWHIDLLGCYMNLPKNHYVKGANFNKDGSPSNYYISKPSKNTDKGVIVWQRVFKDSCEAKIHFFKKN